MAKLHTMGNSILTRRRYKKDLFIIMTLSFLPFLIYLHNIIPDVKTYNFILFKLTSNYYENLQVWFWVVSIKLVYIITYIIWFSTCQYWWKNVILVPLIYFLAQLFVVFDDELNFVDKNEIFVGFLISLPIIFVIFVVTKKMGYFSKSKSLNNELDFEINEIMEELSKFKIEDYKNIKLEFNNLKKNKDSLVREVYLSKLIILREQLHIL